MFVNQIAKAAILALLLLTGCRQQEPTSSTPPARPGKTGSERSPAGKDDTNKIARFDAWRQQRTSNQMVTSHGFVTASWFHPDGLTHYFVSELLSYEVAKADAKRLHQCAATAELAALFRSRIGDLVAQWPQAPTVDDGFAELHFGLDADQAEIDLQAYLDHRRRDTVRIHRLWLR